MLKIIIELHPFGRSHEKKVLEEIFIGNMGPVDPKNENARLFNYDVWHNKNPKVESAAPPLARIKHFRSHGALRLVGLAVDAILRQG